MMKLKSLLRVDTACGNVCLHVNCAQVLQHLKTIGEANLHCAVAMLEPIPIYRILISRMPVLKMWNVYRQVQKSDRINSDRQSGSDQLGLTRTVSDHEKQNIK